MNYIINPSWFYWLGIANGTKTMFFVIAGIAAVGTVFGLVLMATTIEYGTNDEDYKNGKRIAKVCGIIAVVFALVGMLIPSKQTMIEMMVAKFATYENAQWTVDAVKSVVDYIVEAIKSIG